jgi:enoyl-CoA hydratase
MAPNPHLHVAHSRHAEIEILTLTRPPANAMDIALLDELRGAFTSLAGDDSTRAIVLTGDGATFCAGLDVKAVPHYSKAQQLRLLDVLNGMILAAYGCPLPVVAAVNGHAIAGGLVLALCCDWRIVVDAPIRAGLAEVKVAIPFPVAAIEVVRAELSPQAARRMVLSGENDSLAELLAAGVFDQSAPREKLLETALAKASRYAELPRASFATIKRQLKGPTLDAIAAALREGREPLRDSWISPETLAATTPRPR